MARDGYVRVPTDASYPPPPAPPAVSTERTIADVIYPPGFAERLDAGVADSDISEDEFEERELLSKEKLYDDLNSSAEEWPQRRRRSTRRRIFFPVLLATLALGSFILILVLSNSHLVATNPNLFVEHLKKVEIDHIFNGTFRAKSMSIDWLKEGPDGTFSYLDDNRNIVMEHVETGKKEVLVNFEDVKDKQGEQLHFASYRVSSDLKSVIFAANTQKQWRYSSHSNFYVHEISSSITSELHEPSYPPKTSIAVWAPVGNTIAYVHSNDVYLSLPSRRPLQLTTSGSTTMFNGIPDWVMEEENLGSDTALYWSPQGDKLIWLSFEESKVPEFCFPIYNKNPYLPGGEPYTEDYCLKYPKPGYDNPVITIHMFDLSNSTSESELRQEDVEGRVWELAFPDDGEGEFGNDAIVVDVVWVGQEEVVIKQTNRIQTKFRVAYFDMKDPKVDGRRLLGWVTRYMDFEKIDGGWVEPGQFIHPLPASDMAPPGYLEVLPDRDGYNHIAFFSPFYASQPIFITHGPWEVADTIKAIDVDKGVVYFMAATPASERHLYSAPLPNKITFPMLQEGRPPVAPTRLTAESYYSTSFSPQAGYYVLNYLGPSIPHQSIVKTGYEEFTKVLEDNQELYNTTLQFPQPEIVRGTVTIDGNTFETAEMRPPHFDDTGRTKYPVLFEVYGGPASQKTGTLFQRDWHYFLSASMNYVIVRVDGRGTGYRGRRWRTVTKNNLGELEAKDVVDVARSFAERDYIDSARVGVWGWSYGGYLTSKIIETNSSVFSLAMIVAPVTDWRYYDSVYTERYMSTPELNPEGYEKAAVVNMDGFKQLDFVLAHGTGDDNVHFQNSAVLLDRLTMAGVDNFRFRAFTDSNHGMNMRQGYVGLMHYLTTFLNEKWGLGKPAKKIEDHPNRE
ncbi:hypothetical protein BT69DRAFT_1331937 [Atractiella rhizophila]|nr:hypothetical protein BT69DRAFT_1331937 [Atractiella rhizophila]